MIWGFNDCHPSASEGRKFLVLELKEIKRKYCHLNFERRGYYLSIFNEVLLIAAAINLKLALKATYDIAIGSLPHKMKGLHNECLCQGWAPCGRVLRMGMGVLERVVAGVDVSITAITGKDGISHSRKYY